MRRRRVRQREKEQKKKKTATLVLKRLWRLSLGGRSRASSRSVTFWGWGGSASPEPPKAAAVTAARSPAPGDTIARERARVSLRAEAIVFPPAPCRRLPSLAVTVVRLPLGSKLACVLFCSSCDASVSFFFFFFTYVCLLQSVQYSGGCHRSIAGPSLGKETAVFVFTLHACKCVFVWEYVLRNSLQMNVNVAQNTGGTLEYIYVLLNRG